MARLPSLTGKQVVRALERGGFAVIRIKASHHFLRHRHDATRQTVVPVHSSDDLGRAILHKILKDVGLTSDEFIALL